jgi:hypothetical protein
MINNLIFSKRYKTIVLMMVSCFFTVVTLFAQNVTFEIPWSKPIMVTEDGVQRSIPSIATGSYQDGLPLFSASIDLIRGVYDVSYQLISTESASNDDEQIVASAAIVIGNDPIIKLLPVETKKGTSISVSLIPYYFLNGQLIKITAFSVSYTYKGSISLIQPKDYVTNSVLSSGSWYKISVSTDGVYKIDKQLLQSLGVDITTLSPSSLNVYGNASGRLSEANNDFYFDDLIKNPILAIGETDGVFNENDYFAFYAAGPHRWNYTNLNGFERIQNIYSDVAHYFIHIDATDAPSRIQTIDNSTMLANQTVSDYTYYDIHEVEKYNLVKGGQRWYGELFDGFLSQDFNFNIPDLVIGQPITLKYAFATNARTGGNFFQIKQNNQLLTTQNASAVSGDYARNVNFVSYQPATSNQNYTIVFNRVNPTIKGYLDYLTVIGRRNLVFNGSQFQFRDIQSVGVGNSTLFNITSSNPNMLVWEITNKRSPKVMSGSFTAATFAFKQVTDSLREFIVFSSTNLLSPSAVGIVQNQNIHGLPNKDYVIVTHPNFLNQAERLAALHEANGTSTHVVTTEQVYNEFSCGTQDATAIRRMMKMFYDRAGLVDSLKPKHLLLFGDATYDPKNRLGDNNYFVPSFQVLNSENHIAALVTDDYFGLLDDNAGINGSDQMRIGVGRLLISTQEQAVQQVNKIEHYMKNGSQFFSGGSNDCCSGDLSSSFGDWRTNYTLITDDEEGGYFVNVDAEPVSQNVYAAHPEINVDKLYSDAFVQTSGAGGERYPAVYDAITDRIERGSLITNYVGHGGEVGAAEERIITIPQIQAWSNINKLGLFVTATCEFTKFDDPSRVSAGEWVSLNPTGGAIALMTTTRSVYFGVNSTTIDAFYNYVFEREPSGKPMTFGKIIQLTKNNSQFSENRRCFSLIGDPALTIALPRYVVVTDSINHLAVNQFSDTIKALSKMHVSGHLEDSFGNTLSGFNGILSPTIFDKVKANTTLMNDPESPLISFKTQKNALYKGKATVLNGNFQFEFLVPKDIDYSFGKGRISYYANDNLTDAIGYDTNFVVGGINTNAQQDIQGPTIQVYLNDNNFVNGGTTSTSPLLIVEAFDESGINTVGNGVGHDLIAILDGNSGDPIVLNNYYTASLDNYQSGKINYTLRNLTPGDHTLDVKIWDVNNNSSVQRLLFTVIDEQQVALQKVLNYPNPFTTKTTFFFEHNQSCASLETQIQIFTVSGRLVRTINQTVPTAGFRIDGIDWDGKDDFGDQLAKGVYVYKISINLPEGGKAEKVEKLVLLR